MLYIIGQRVDSGTPVTLTQAREAKRVYEQAITLGFDPDTRVSYALGSANR